MAIGKNGADIPVEEAVSYVAGITLGIDLTLRDLQSKLKQAGQPWELSKSFDGSAVIGKFITLPSNADIQSIEMRCSVNGDLRQQGNTRDMLFPVAEIIAFLSRHWRLLPGDLIFTGTPAGVGPLQPGDRNGCSPRASAPPAVCQPRRRTRRRARTPNAATPPPRTGERPRRRRAEPPNVCVRRWPSGARLASRSRGSRRPRSRRTPGGTHRRRRCRA